MRKLFLNFWWKVWFENPIFFVLTLAWICTKLEWIYTNLEQICSNLDWIYSKTGLSILLLKRLVRVRSIAQNIFCIYLMFQPLSWWYSKLINRNKIFYKILREVWVDSWWSWLVFMFHHHQSVDYWH